MIPFPDLGTLWTHDKWGLLLLIGARPYATTTWGEDIYSVDVLILHTQHRTTGLFSAHDWHACMTQSQHAHV
jgi:hypothetical protein